MFKDIKFIYFDLDNTIFDHKRAEQTTLKQLRLQNEDLFSASLEDAFLNTYHAINTRLWQDFANNKITADELKLKRFALTLSDLKIDTGLASAMAADYMTHYSRQAFMLDGALEVLNYLKPKYRLGILSNGFTETQHQKIRNLKIGSFFEQFIYSGEVGALKPSPKIFEAARVAANVQPDEIVYVGDSFESDILGAYAAQWKTVFFNRELTHEHQNTADATITRLSELREFF